MYPELSEAERFPILSPKGRQLLYRMRQHAKAPIWNWPNGEQLDAPGLELVRNFSNALCTSKWGAELGEPEWLDDYADRCIREVPYYRSRNPRGISFQSIHTSSRADLAPRVWDFVPDDALIDQLIVFSSSGTTGYPTRTPHHPFSAACGIPLIEHALRTLHGIELHRGPDRVAITNVAAYPGAFTTAIVVSYLQEAGCVRVNLHPSAWRNPSDRSDYINEWKAPIWLGDPVAYQAIEELEIDHRPAAIVSSIMHLHHGYAQHLASRYECPVLDLYAMTEAGIIAVGTGDAGTGAGHRILPHDLFVEILDEFGNRCDPGIRGEITLTGGRNPFLPLLRYRTGDYGALEWIDGYRVITGLHGREPNNYETTRGKQIHSMEIVRLMREFPVVRFQVDRLSDGAFALTFQGSIDEVQLSQRLEDLFEEPVELRKMDL